MQLKKIILIIFIFFTNKIYCQSLEGVFTIDKNDKTYYLNFANNKFEIINLEQNYSPYSKSHFTLSEHGIGKYFKRENELILTFENLPKKFNYSTKDSVAISMNTDFNSSSKKFEVKFHDNIKSLDNNYFIVEGLGKSYNFPIRNGYLNVSLPDTILIKNISIQIMGLDRKVLSFDNHFNNYQVDYYLNDFNLNVNIIKDDKWVFDIINDSSFVIDKSKLIKVDNKILEFLKNKSLFEKRINDIITYWQKPN